MSKLIFKLSVVLVMIFVCVHCVLSVSAENEYKIIVPKGKDNVTVGEAVQLSVKGLKNDKIKWEVYEDDSCTIKAQGMNISKKGVFIADSVGKENPNSVTICATIGDERVVKDIDVYAKRNQSEYEELKRIINSTNLRKKIKKRILSKYRYMDYGEYCDDDIDYDYDWRNNDENYCEWDVNGHLVELALEYCRISSLSLNKFKHLRVLRINATDLRSIDLSGCKELCYLDVFNNPLTKVDISHNKNVYYANLEYNRINNIDLSKNKQLKELNLSYNRLSDFKALKCTKLKELNIEEGGKKLKAIDVRGCTSLENFNAPNNRKLKKLLLPSSDALKTVMVENCSSLKKLDITHSPNAMNLYLYASGIKKVYTIEKGFEHLTCNTDTRFIYKDKEYTAEEYCHRSYESAFIGAYDILNDMWEDEEYIVSPFSCLSGKEYDIWLKYYYDVPDVDYVKLNHSAIRMKLGLTRKMELKYADAPKEVVWKSSDDRIISFDSSGNAFAVGEGEAKITAEYRGREYTCDVNVTEADANNDEEELKKLINQQIDCGVTGISTDIHDDSQYNWREGRLIGINWNHIDISGLVNLNAFTYLEYFYNGESFGGCWSIDADDLLYLKKVTKNPWKSNSEFDSEVHAENAKELIIETVR
ncbi:MAG: hypothetical protein K5656_03370 [Lachnospiraceae bacterium]|nr:hypothetical protein [Lachnospiraceae bacterium]